MLLLVSLLAVQTTYGAEKYVGTCNVEFEGDSTLHGFTGHITNLALVVFTVEACWLAWCMLTAPARDRTALTRQE